MFVAEMAFHAKVSDPRIGGTYMTLLNTVSNLGMFTIKIPTNFTLQVFVYSMFVSQMAFNAKISDPTIGGTYMTLLNTVANLGKVFIKV